MANGWKITSIVFIILFVLETSILIWLTFQAIEDLNEEDICMYDICGGNKIITYDSYTYDDRSKICSCYISGEIIKEKKIE
ncbi:hypothetical protein LCGC14_0546230 [marine sediment metagenome]|uniref:Uncharacterized protein n=1 Tax=marine sediment metagenome TaxID=412755 RepID=A0A0F9UZM1_9ZZZZ